MALAIGSSFCSYEILAGYGTTAIGACQNAARSLAGSITVTWQSSRPGGTSPSGIVNRTRIGFDVLLDRIASNFST